MANTDKTLIESLINDLKRQRDEVRLQLHLGSQEIKDEWAKLDDQLNVLIHRFDPLSEAVGETASGVWESLKLVGDEIRTGFERIRQSL